MYELSRDFGIPQTVPTIAPSNGKSRRPARRSWFRRLFTKKE